jgi:hypothetical protein
MSHSILYYSKQVQEDIMNLPDTLQARYIGLTTRMIEHGLKVSPEFSFARWWSRK